MSSRLIARLAMPIARASLGASSSGVGRCDRVRRSRPVVGSRCVAGMVVSWIVLIVPGKAKVSGAARRLERLLPGDTFPIQISAPDSLWQAQADHGAYTATVAFARDL
ncbi:hypothetical protein CHELA1G11_14750 [Hyphomicrobiales bacterium]|nr:hypothetical protein CHELA1G11_14750 [Hyphomicrobiales bacterium]